MSYPQQDSPLARHVPHGQQVEFRAGAAARNQYLLVACGFVVMALFVVGGQIPAAAPWGAILMAAAIMAVIAAVVMAFIAASRGVALGPQGLTIRGFHAFATSDGMPANFFRGFWTTRRYPWSQIRSITKGRLRLGDVTIVKLVDGTTVLTFAPMSHWAARDPAFDQKLAVMQQWHAHYTGHRTTLD